MRITYLYSSCPVTFSGLAGDCTAAFTLSSGSSSACGTRIMFLCTEVVYKCTSKVKVPIAIMRSMAPTTAPGDRQGPTAHLIPAAFCCNKAPELRCTTSAFKDQNVTILLIK